ncbi:MAG: iron ABC transporter permease, partial [Candidatus Eremiobacteraeota bacterium]|nr:iron ABC transporter permease [Candidatus Eremiobacteraeota bacterium]
PILNSLELAGGVACIAVAVGTPLAWLVSRTDIPFRGAIRALILAAFVTPEFLGAEAWIFLAAPTSGWLNKGYCALTHSTGAGPFNVYTMPFAIFVVALYTIPYAFTFVTGTLDMVPSEMEDAAALLGANPVRTALSVTLPLAAPAIAAAFLMSFLESLGLFGAPAILLIPARQETITTQIFQFFQFPQRVEVAAAYAMPLLLITLALLAVQRRLLGRKTFTVVGGKGGRPRRYALGKWRILALVAALVPSVLAIVAPYGALLATSLSQSWGNGIVASNLTLHWYRWALFENPDVRTAIGHSFSYGAIASAIALVVAASIAYAAVRRIVPGAPLLGVLCTAPVVVPGIVLALGLFATYSRPPVVLYGTSAMLVLAFATRFLPAAFSNVTSLVRGVHPELENAARTLGATRLRVLGTITIPILRRGLFATWLLVFVPMLRELSAAVFLSTPKTAVVTTMMYNYTDEGNFEPVAALGIIMMAITLALVFAVNRLGGRAGVASEVR